jgi:hypothetical protein
LEPILSVFIVCAAAFLAGNLNALAGGGSFITLPALIFLGISPINANTTSAASLLPGYFGSVIGFKNLYRDLDRKHIITLASIASASSVLGALLLINTEDEVFISLLPWLILLATLLFIFNPKRSNKEKSGNLAQFLGVSLVSVYGGYFNGGLGIATLAALSLGREMTIKHLSAIKSLLSFLLTSVSVCIFFISGYIEWSYVFYMMIFSAIGGFCGAKLTQALPEIAVRRFIIFTGFLVTILLFLY